MTEQRSVRGPAYPAAMPRRNLPKRTTCATFKDLALCKPRTMQATARHLQNRKYRCAIGSTVTYGRRSNENEKPDYGNSSRRPAIMDGLAATYFDAFLKGCRAGLEIWQDLCCIPAGKCEKYRERKCALGQGQVA
jgi:hypothetical protein